MEKITENGYRDQIASLKKTLESAARIANEYEKEWHAAKRTITEMAQERSDVVTHLNRVHNAEIAALRSEVARLQEENDHLLQCHAPDEVLRLHEEVQREKARADGFKEFLRQAENSAVERGFIIEAVGDLLEGKEVSDFAESFPIVLSVQELKARADGLAADLATVDEDRNRATLDLFKAEETQKKAESALAAARERIENQAERIRILEGPTNHAGGLRKRMDDPGRVERAHDELQHQLANLEEMGELDGMDAIVKILAATDAEPRGE